MLALVSSSRQNLTGYSPDLEPLNVCCYYCCISPVSSYIIIKTAIDYTLQLTLFSTVVDDFHMLFIIFHCSKMSSSTIVRTNPSSLTSSLAQSDLASQLSLVGQEAAFDSSQK